MSQAQNYMAIDQYGQTHHNLGPNPRKGLMERMCVKGARKFYVDKKDGRTVHVGWIVNGLWCTVYEVKRMESEA